MLRHLPAAGCRRSAGLGRLPPRPVPSDRSPPAVLPSHRRLLCPTPRAPPPRQALTLITNGAREASFRNIKSISECLADELMNAAKGSSNSYAIKKKDETERVAKTNR